MSVENTVKVIINVSRKEIGSNSLKIYGDTEYLSVFSPNAGKCRPEQLRIRTLFTQ